MPMIIAPDIFRQVQGQPLATDAALGGQPPLQIPPEAFQPVDMCPIRRDIVALAMFDQAVHIAFRRNARIALPRVREDRRAACHPSTNQGPQGAGLHLRHDLRPDLPVPAEDAEDRGFGRASAAFGASGSNGLAFVLPLAA